MEHIVGDARGVAQDDPGERERPSPDAVVLAVIDVDIAGGSGIDDLGAVGGLDASLGERRRHARDGEAVGHEDEAGGGRGGAG
jgi:hypothetical protein